MMKLFSVSSLAVAKWVSKVSRIYCALWLVSKIRANFSINEKQNQTKMMPCLQAFSRARRQLHVFASSSDWFLVLFVSDVIGWGNCFGFGFMTLIWKLLHSSLNRPFSKMAATDLNELKLNWMKNWYQHWKEHLYFSNLAKFRHIRCYISLGNVRWNSTNLQTFVWLGVYVILPVIQTSVNFSFFNLHFLRWYYTWYAETLQGY